MTLEELAALEQIILAATPGPWAVDVDQERNDISLLRPGSPVTSSSEGEPPVYVAGLSYSDQGERDAEFIVAARQYALPLVSAVRSYARERDEAREQLTRLRNAIMEAVVRAGVRVQPNLPFHLIDVGSWERIKDLALADFPDPSPIVTE